MPLIIDGGRIPPRWAERMNWHRAESVDRSATRTDCVSIAFVNNMPDAALEDTEMQFLELLDAAVDGITLRVKFHSLRGVPRGEGGQQHLNRFYFSTDDLLNDRFDGMIMTGTEPRQSNLRDEPYWSALANVLNWAESNTASTILSCLAAHAGVLYSDGINRHPLSDKQFGVFDFANAGDHQFTSGAGERVRFPHSRWNEVQGGVLTACGYRVLMQSSDGGVDSFVKKKKRSLFLHFQGHPEYGAQTLLKEYRRDIRRFLKRERDTYPSMPKGYFDAAHNKVLGDFQEAALANPREEAMAAFPDAAVAGTLQKTWQSAAIAIYRNWLHYVASQKAESSTFQTVAAVYESVQRKRSALP
jgi:homoserine O-succinyltransferase/O-acetyltransferase